MVSVDDLGRVAAAAIKERLRAVMGEDGCTREEAIAAATAALLELDAPILRIEVSIDSAHPARLNVVVTELPSPAEVLLTVSVTGRT